MGAGGVRVSLGFSHWGIYTYEDDGYNREDHQSFSLSCSFFGLLTRRMRFLKICVFGLQIEEPNKL